MGVVFQNILLWLRKTTYLSISTNFWVPKKRICPLKLNMNSVEIKIRVLKNNGEKAKRNQKAVKMYGKESGRGRIKFRTT